MNLSSISLISLFCIAAILAKGSALPQLSSSLGPVVNLGYAAFAGNSTSPSGEVNGPVTFFGGIPYAKPPIGDLRSRAPVPLDEKVVDEGNVTITDARNWGSLCIQQPAQVGIGSEDCLTLNVWKPTDAKEGDKLPVIVYIHTPQGFPLYDWVNQSKTKIAGVTIAYHLNLLGFLAGDAVQHDGDLNVGLLDQRAALEWVQRHITKFGGDPDQVTIDGQSAGGGSVIMQMVAFADQRDSCRAIGQSMGHNSTPTAEEAEAAFRTVTEVVGCSASGPESMPCLRRASVGAIVAAINAVPGVPPGPVIDGPSGILPDLPASLVLSGNFTPVDIVAGHCTTEGRTLLPPPDELVTEEDVVRDVLGDWPHLTNETIQQALALYPAPGTPGSPYRTQYNRAGTIAQDMMVGCLDCLLASKSREERKKPRMYSPTDSILQIRFYSPNFRFKVNNVRMTLVSADRCYQTHIQHISSAPNAGFTFTPFNSTEGALSKESLAFWTSFISTGNPSASRELISPEWLPFSSGSRMVLNQPTNSSLMSASIMEVTPPDEVERCKFWMSENVMRQTRL
ncbi:hypothetical protein ACEPAG_9701 [Sanghuangporus baumii]